MQTLVAAAHTKLHVTFNQLGLKSNLWACFFFFPPPPSSIKWTLLLLWVCGRSAKKSYWDKCIKWHLLQFHPSCSQARKSSVPFHMLEKVLRQQQSVGPLHHVPWQSHPSEHNRLLLLQREKNCTAELCISLSKSFTNISNKKHIHSHIISHKLATYWIGSNEHAWFMVMLLDNMPHFFQNEHVRKTLQL